MPVSLLPVLQQTALKGIKITVLSWEHVFSTLISHFHDVLPTAVKVKSETDPSIKDPADARTLLCYVSAEGLSPEEYEDALARFKALVSTLRDYCGRYQVQLVCESKPKLEGTLFRLTFHSNSALNSAAFFREELELQKEVVLNLGPTFRIVWSLVETHGRTLIRLQCQDTENNAWYTCLDRTFTPESYRHEEIDGLIRFFTSVL